MIDAQLRKQLRSKSNETGFTLSVHLRAADGITVLLGPSGSGKTLTLNCLAGFARPDSGRILVDDHLFFDGETQVNLLPEARRCGYLFQEDTLFPHMTVRGNLQFAASLHARKGRAARREINDLLEAFELSAFAQRRPSELSGGQKQRAALARMLLGEPRLLLLDEPTRGLDARLRETFYDVLRAARERLGVPAVLVTHDLEECFALADHVCLLDNGQFLQAGPAQSVFAKPASVDAARFLGIYSVLPAEIVTLDPSRNTSRVRVGKQEILGPYFGGQLIGDRGFVCFRTAELQARAPSGQAGEWVLACESAALAPGGVRLRLEGGLTVMASEELRWAERVAVFVPPAAITFVSA